MGSGASREAPMRRASAADVELSEPYVSASLVSSSDVIDLSSETTLDIRVVLTIHGDKPVLFSLANLHVPAHHYIFPLQFYRSGKEVPESAKLSFLTQPDPEDSRRLELCALLVPEQPTSFQVYLNSPRHWREPPDQPRFDDILFHCFKSFKSGSRYDAQLDPWTISHWRTATPEEMDKFCTTTTGTQETMQDFRDDVVAIPRREKALNVTVEGEAITLLCVGKLVPYRKRDQRLYGVCNARVRHYW